VFVTVVEMPNVRGIKIYGLLYKPEAENLRVEINVLLRVSSNSGDVVDAVRGYAHLNLQSGK